MLVMGSNLNTLQLAIDWDIIDNKISVKKKSFTHDFPNERSRGKDSVHHIMKIYFTETIPHSMVVNMRRILKGFKMVTDSSLIKQLGVVGSIGVDRTTLFGGDTNNSGGRPEETNIYNF